MNRNNLKNVISILTLFSLFICCSTKDNTNTKQKKNRVSKKWIGKWKREKHMNNATLEIKKIESDSIKFELLAVSGANDGGIEGVAKVKNNIAIFILSDNDDSCLITFELVSDNMIEVEQKKGNCQTGLFVTYSGTYRNEKYISKSTKTISLLELDIFKTKSQDSTFKVLVGDSYPLFVNSTQLSSEGEDLDKLNASVTTSGVRGLYTFMENIVMIDASNNIWTAVINDNKVYYFTNRADYKVKLPKTIDDWRSRFKDYEVIYQ